jgi:hypothetical protein
MLTIPKTKNELIEELKKEKPFTVLSVYNGKATNVAKEISGIGSKEVTVIVIQTK